MVGPAGGLVDFEEECWVALETIRVSCEGFDQVVGVHEFAMARWLFSLPADRSVDGLLQ